MEECGSSTFNNLQKQTAATFVLIVSDIQFKFSRLASQSPPTSLNSQSETKPEVLCRISQHMEPGWIQNNFSRMETADRALRLTSPCLY